MNGLYNLKRTESPPPLSTYWPYKERGQFQFSGSDIEPLSDIESLTEPDMAPITMGTNIPASPLEPTAKKTTSLMDYWKQPVFGKIPLDQFVRLAGMLGHAIAPETPMGRAGSVLGQMGAGAYAERMKREEEELKYQQEEPDRLLKRELIKAQTKKLGELKEPTPHFEPTIQNGMFGQYDVNNKKFIPVRPATEEDKRKIETGKIKESITKYQKIGETDKGLPLGYDSTTNQYVVTLKDGSIQPFDEKIHGRKIEKESKVPSLGNIAEIAIGRKFTDPAYLTDPEKHKEALKWLGTDEGSKALKKARDELTAPAVTFLQTAEGFVPVTTKGEEIGKVGKPTGLGKPLSPEMVVAQQQIGTIKETLDRVKKTYNPNFVGAVAGRVGGLAEKTIGVPKDQAQFYSDVAQLKNSLIYLLSGKQINETEYKRLLDQLPTRELPSGVFEARMENFEKTVDSIISNRQKGMGGYGKQGQPIKNDPLGIR